MITYPKELLPTKQQKAKAVKFANEVLTFVLKDKRFSIDSGNYFLVRLDDDAKYESNVKKLFKNEKNMKCEVCALGALYAAKVNRENQVYLGAKISWSSSTFEVPTSLPIRGIIGDHNASAIECCFEQSVGFCEDSYNDEFVEICRHAAYTYTTLTFRKRLYQICKNIIKNNGVFLPKGVKLE